MSTIFCQKLHKETAGLEAAPFPGELGQKVLATISAEAWAMWIQQQTMLINEYRLSTIEPQARAFLRAEMEKFLFGEGSSPPPGFTGPVSK